MNLIFVYKKSCGVKKLKIKKNILTEFENINNNVVIIMHLLILYYYYKLYKIV